MLLYLWSKAKVHSTRKKVSFEAASSLKERLPSNLQRAMDLTTEKGASSWLTALPIEEHGYTLHKRAFLDAFAYSIIATPSRLPSTCACGSSHTTEHAPSWLKGRFPSITHNEIWDLTTHLMTEICNDVHIEPDLQPLTGEHFDNAKAITQDGAHVDISANGFWEGRYEKTFYDLQIFNLYAPSNMQSSLSACYKKHERLKKNAYTCTNKEWEKESMHPSRTSCFPLQPD